ncbi:MAG: hypothetical protein ABSD13_20655, partial [Candidatus Korobacteraceae bacterium]
QPGWKSHPTIIMKASPDPEGLVLNQSIPSPLKPSFLSHQLCRAPELELCQLHSFTQRCALDRIVAFFFLEVADKNANRLWGAKPRNAGRKCRAREKHQFKFERSMLLCSDSS